MSLELHELSGVDYNALRYEIIANIEDEKNHAYIDSEGYVTIGAGFNLHEDFVRDLVLSAFFEINEENSPEIYQQLVDIFSQRYQVDARGNPLPGETERLNNALNAVMETWAQGGDNRPSTFVIEDAGGQTWRQRVRAFFENNFSQEYEDKVTGFIQNHPVMLENVTALVLPNSKERAALFSLAYNQRDNNRPLLAEGLGTALENGDRRAAWFEIRYASNFGNVNGIAKRRFYESQVFGLYNHGEDAATAATEILDFLYNQPPLYPANGAKNLEMLIQKEELFLGSSGSSYDAIASYDLVGSDAALGYGDIFKFIAKDLLSYNIAC